MKIDSSVREIMMGALERNLRYQKGERIALIGQRWEPHLPEDAKSTMNRAMSLWTALTEIYGDAGVKVFPFAYSPSTIGSTVEPTEQLSHKMRAIARSIGEPDIVLAPTAYSITHTDFVKEQARNGSRIATMSNSSLAMFALGGPFDSQEDPSVVIERTNEIADILRKTEYVKITGKWVNLVIHMNPKLVHASTGVIEKPGEIGNWLGAEAYVVPVDPRDGGKSNGWFAIPDGFGGRDQLDCMTRFEIRDGRFVSVQALDSNPQSQAELDTNVKPRFFGTANYDIVAELGFGTNAAVSEEYLRKNWSIAVAEKMYHSRNGRTVHVAAGNSSGMGGRNNVKHHEDWMVLDVKDIDFTYKPESKTT